MGSKDEKTNVMRILDQKGVKYKYYAYENKDVVSGTQVAQWLGIDAERMYKTLVTVGKSGEHYVFVIPVGKELNLKRAAAAAGEKSIEMLKSKDLLPLTGYIHGGCSPIGMKKLFKTFFDGSAAGYETIVFSAGKIGRQVELPLAEVERVIPFSVADLTD